MAFVPIVPHVPAPPSERARELGGLLARVIDEYGHHHPDLSGSDVRDALDLATRTTSVSTAGDRSALRGLVLGTVVVLAIGVVVVSRSTEGALPLLAVLVGVLSVVALAVVLRRAGDL